MDLVHFGQMVRTARIARGLLQADLAKELGKTVSFVGLIERGQRSVSIDTLIDLCRVLVCPPSQLLCASLDGTDKREG